MSGVQDRPEVSDKAEGAASSSKAVEAETQAGMEELSNGTKAYYQARRDGARDPNTLEHLPPKPQFFDSSAATARFDQAQPPADSAADKQARDGNNVTRDSSGRVTDVTYPNGKSSHVKYDGDGNPTEVKLGEDLNWKKEDGKWVQYDRNGEEVGKFSGDIVVSQDGDIAAVGKDGTDIFARHPDGSETSIVDKSQVAWDKNGRVTDVVYPNGKSSHVKYDGDGNPTEVKLGEDLNWKKEEGKWVQYDRHGKQKGSFSGDILVSEDGDIAAVTKDGKDIFARHPDGSETQIFEDQSQVTWDQKGRVTSVTRENGHTATFAYDKNGSLSEFTMPDKSFKKEDGVWTEYDPDGNKVGTFDGDFAVTAEGDVTVIGTDNSSIIYHRDGSVTDTAADKSQVVTRPDGHVVSVTYPTGDTTKVEYDDEGFPNKISTSNRSELVREDGTWVEYKNGKKVGPFNGEIEVGEDGSIVLVDEKGRMVTKRDGTVDATKR